jgi:hypothetical protein
MAKAKRDPLATAIRKDTIEIRKDTKRIRKHVEKPLTLDLDPFKPIIDFLKDVWKLLNQVSKGIGGIPGQIVNALAQRAGGTIGRIVQTFSGLAATLVQPVAFVPVAVKYLTGRTAARRSQRDPRMHRFFEGIAQLTVRINKLATAYGVGMNIKVPEPVQAAFLTQVFDQIPPLLLAPARLILDPVAGWEEIPGKIVSELDQLPSERDALFNQVRTNADTRKVLRHVRYIAKIVNVLVGTAISILPRDLTVHIEIAGEGGGTQLMGHPVAWVFQIAKLVLDLTDVVISYILEVFIEPGLVAQAT